MDWTRFLAKSPFFASFIFVTDLVEKVKDCFFQMLPSAEVRMVLLLPTATNTPFPKATAWILVDVPEGMTVHDFASVERTIAPSLPTAMYILFP
ncbi:hypothetical protein D3C72_2234940 [compost metagenome]